MRILLVTLLLCSTGILFANEPSSAIYLKVQKLHSLKRVLYVAAHPDDENTRALAYFSLGELAETAYFSLTRGDGGQNLIGNELGDPLGVLRTQELLAARSFDKARQYFSHAVDFGYSRSAEESFDMWGKDVLLADLVEMIRRFQPDVIITRFPPDERAGHGHHTASALLAIEALEKAADPKYLPEQVKKIGTWQAAAVYWNTSTWWDENINESTKNDPDYLITDIGGYNPYLGMSYNEIGTLARSQHKCQGFGGLIERGSRTEYFKYLAGTRLKSSLFELNTRNWSALGGAEIDAAFTKLLDGYNFVDPSRNVASLLEVLEKLEAMPASPLRDEKVGLCREIIQDCLGLYVELVGPDYAYVIGDSVSLQLNMVNRSALKLSLQRVELSNGTVLTPNQPLGINTEWTQSFKIMGGGKPGTPYWLESPHGALFQIDKAQDPLQAENKAAITATLLFDLEGRAFRQSISADYKWRDPSYGERRRPLIPVPAFTATFEDEILLARQGQKIEVRVRIHSFVSKLDDMLHVHCPAGWHLEGNDQKVEIDHLHGEKVISLYLTPGPLAERGLLHIENARGQDLHSFQEIVYDHIPTQSLFGKTEILCVPLETHILGGKIAYIKGVEDGLPQAMRQLGYEVDEYEVSALNTVDLSNYRSVVLGIRIYNVHEELRNSDPKLFEYVQNGGNLVMQYITAPRTPEGTKFGPLPFEISRDRVTEENATVHFLKPEHPILNTPNKITTADFEGWVQERGLYFAANWDTAYVPLLSWADKGQPAADGGLIVAPYGKGQFVYTGISFFRELPAGVVGAYRLLANILSFQP